MEAIAYSHARSNLAQTIVKVCDDHAPRHYPLQKSTLRPNTKAPFMLSVAARAAESKHQIYP